MSRILIIASWFGLICGSIHSRLVCAGDEVSFKKDVAPILLDNCLACHGPKKAEGGYRVDTFERAVSEGDSGDAAFQAKEPDNSEALRRIISDDVDERMPLEGDPLPKKQIDLIKKWIEQGAKFDGENPKAPLAAIIPPPTHPAPPEVYPHNLPITALTFSRDGKQLLAAGYHEVTVWSAENGQLRRRIHNVGQRTYALCLSPDGAVLAVGGGAPGRLGEVRLFDVESGSLQRVLGTTSDVVLDLAYSPDGKRLAVASADGVLRVFNPADGKLELTITSHSDWVMAIAWSGDGGKLVSASRDKTAKVFDAKTGELTVTYSGHAQPVKGVAFHPDGKEIYSSAADNKVQIWKIADGKKTADVTSFGGEAYKLVAEGGFLFVGSADKSVRQFNLKDRKQVRAYSGPKDWVLSADYHQPSKRMAAGAFDGRIHIWNTDDGKLLLSFVAAPGRQADPN